MATIKGLPVISGNFHGKKVLCTIFLGINFQGFFSILAWGVKLSWILFPKSKETLNFRITCTCIYITYPKITINAIMNRTSMVMNADR